jgi:hypothetical protein
VVKATKNGTRLVGMLDYLFTSWNWWWKQGLLVKLCSYNILFYLAFTHHFTLKINIWTIMIYHFCSTLTCFYFKVIKKLPLLQNFVDLPSNDVVELSSIRWTTKQSKCLLICWATKLGWYFPIHWRTNPKPTIL